MKRNMKFDIVIFSPQFCYHRNLKPYPGNCYIMYKRNKLKFVNPNSLQSDEPLIFQT